ncbi:MocR-like pyridoxine biosynthesis transcription factor PdxR [Evansella halocellulosilytica]|uniref:MocR-like pyridoxine biosynthesis transcription factor PdxR n=1 Tax=Evansella halocellulosilytica TaxID=2011013 RepID=UPI000BB6D5BC|nr:PLP-dependent aminotransferase family protein [Evansella halocellulosilytica]
MLIVNRKNGTSLTQQVYEQIRSRILEQEFKEGEKIFSSRELAATLGVSRNVVLEAYEQLIAEGYLEVRPRSGTFVAEGINFQRNVEESSSIANSIDKKEEKDIIDFRAANPAMDQFPRKIWGRLTKEICNDTPNEAFAYSGAEGVRELRDVLANYLRNVRGVRCHPDQIVITSGATQALYLITRLLGNRNDNFIAVEDPVTDEMREIFSLANVEVQPVDVDEKGILPAKLPNKKKPSFLFVIPSHQFPLGGTLSIQRRVQLIEYSRKMDTYIVEDDYDSEFTYEGIPVHSIQGLNPEKVLYVGTFSKILSPALRIGYVVLPSSFVKPYRELKWYTDRHTSSLEQLVLARFIEEGYLGRHVRKMKKTYKERRQTLVNNLKEHFPQAAILGQAAGMHLVVEFPNITFTQQFISLLMESGVRVYPVESYALKKGNHKHQIVMGYGGLTEEDIIKGVKRLKKGISAYHLKK